MEKTFQEFWSTLKSEAQKELSLVEAEVEAINGDFDKFIDSVKEKYGISEAEAREKAEKLYNDLDEIKWDGTEDMIKGRVQEIWGEISNDDWEKIKGSKTQFLGYIKHNFGKSGQEALADLEKLMQN